MLRFQTLKVLDMNIRKLKSASLMQFKTEYLLFDWGLAVWLLVQNGRCCLEGFSLSLVDSCTFGKDIYD